MASEENEYEECISNAEEAILVLSNDQSELSKIEDLKELWDRINVLKDKSNKNIKKTIQDLQNQLEEAKNPDIEVKILVKEENLITKYEAVKLHLEETDKECQEYQEKVKEEEKEKDEFKKILDEVSKNNSYSLPKAKYNVKLYSNISRITWQADTSPDEIKGFICNKTDVQPFFLNTKQQSQYYITNYLWDVMQEDW